MNEPPERDTLEKTRQQVFQSLKPICVSIVDNSSSISREKSRVIAGLLDDLLHGLQSIPNVELTLHLPLIDSILFPLLNLFQSLKRDAVMYENIVESWLKCIHFMLSRTAWKYSFQAQMVHQLIILFTLCIDSPLRPSKKVSEEIKQLAVICIEAALPLEYKAGRIQPQATAIQNQEFQPALAQSITVLLGIIRDESKISLRRDAIQCLSCLLLDNLQDPDLMEKFLPGVASALCRTLWQKKEKENHRIIVQVLELLGDVLVLVMEDCRYQDMFPSLDSLQQFRHLGIAKETKQETDSDRKTSYHMAKKRLYRLLKEVLSEQSHPEWRARLSMVLFSYKILQSCSQSLDNCVQLLIETMVIHTDDDYSEVAEVCQKRMNDLMGLPSFQEVVVPILKERLYTWITDLPRHIIRGQEQEKTGAISLIIGYVTLLRHHVASVLDTALVAASEGWIAALEIDMDNGSIMEERKQRYIDFKGMSTLYPKIHFKHLITDRTAAHIVRMLNMIGRFCDVGNWVSHFMNYIRADDGVIEHPEPQAAFIIHALLAGAASPREDSDILLSVDEEATVARTTKTAMQVLRNMVDLLVDPTNSRQEPLSVTTRNHSDLPSDTILTICFGLQNIGLCAVILGRECMREQSITLLYPILAHLGSTHVFIHTYALITLDAIALVCGEKDVRHLVIHNVDYIINSVSQRITLLHANPLAPLVLRALIHVGGPNTISFLGDSLEEIYDVLETYHQDPWFCQQLCGVLVEAVQTMEKMQQVGDDEDAIIPPSGRLEGKGKAPSVSKEITDLIHDLEKQEQGASDQETSTMEAVGRHFLDRQEKDEPVPDLVTLLEQEQQANKSDKPDKPEDDESVEENEPLSSHEQMTLTIMNRVIHFLSAPSAQLQAQMLLLFAAGAKVLSNRLDHLNPLVHYIWPIVVQRLDHPEHFVKFYAAVLVQTLARVCGDFLSTRVVKDVWPRFKPWLADRSKRVPDYSAYSFAFRLDYCILETLTSIASRVPLRHAIIVDIVEHTKVFLEATIHDDLQRQAVGLFGALAQQDADTIWFYCTTLLCKPDKQPIEDALCAFTVPSWMKPQAPMDYDKNAAMIITSYCT